MVIQDLLQLMDVMRPKLSQKQQQLIHVSIPTPCCLGLQDDSAAQRDEPTSFNLEFHMMPKYVIALKSKDLPKNLCVLRNQVPLAMFLQARSITEDFMEKVLVLGKAMQEVTSQVPRMQLGVIPC
jgi:hypothetical protein